MATNLGLFLAAVLAAALKALYTDPDLPEGRIQHAVLDVFLIFCMLELAYLILKAHRITEAIETAGDLFRVREGHDALIARLDKRICDIRDTLETDDPIYSSVAKAAFRSLDEFSVVPSGIVINTEQLTISFYAEFWKELVLRQQAVGAGFRPERLAIYTTHSASIRLWRRPEFAEVRALQDRFISLGGIVNRVLVNQSQGFETPTEYEEAILEMTRGRDREVRAGRFNMVYLERKDNNAQTDDFLLIVVDSNPYCATWETSWHGSYGSIVRCRIHSDEETFRHYWERWCEIVSEASGWAPLTDLEGIVLRKRPTKRIAALMTKSPTISAAPGL